MIDTIEDIADALAIIEQQFKTTNEFGIINFQAVKVRDGIYEAFGRNSKPRKAFDLWDKRTYKKSFLNLVMACWVAYDELNTGEINPFNNLHLRYVTQEDIAANPFKYHDY